MTPNTFNLVRSITTSNKLFAFSAVRLEENLKGRFRRIDIDERQRHAMNFLMRGAFPSCSTSVPHARNHPSHHTGRYDEYRVAIRPGL
jgi:hypothetical protein